MCGGWCRILDVKAASFANGKTRDGALVGFSEEETYPTPQSSAGYEQQDASCTDRSSDCAGWVASGECKKNPAFMDGTIHMIAKLPALGFCEDSLFLSSKEGLTTLNGAQVPARGAATPVSRELCTSGEQSIV